MTCDQAAEFVSALCDGEAVPRAEAEHISGCAACRARLHSYAEQGAELRLAASVALTEEMPVRVWKRQPGFWRNWWQKGWEQMRVPRLVFAALLVGIVVLGSGLAIVGVHARGEGNVILLKMTPQGKEPTTCALSAVDKKEDVCAYISQALSFQVEVLSKDGDRVNLGIRAIHQLPQDGKSSINSMNIENLPQEKYQFEPGETLRVNVAGYGAISITGEWIDHIPVMVGANGNMDPGPEEMRIVSPILLHGKEVVGDMEGASAAPDHAGQYVEIYMPDAGLFQFSLSQIPGAVQGHVQLNRISFESNGQSYVLVTGAPITRGEYVWVRHEVNFKPTGYGANGYLGVRDLDNAAAGAPAK